MIAPSKQAFVPFLSVANMMRLVHTIGVEQVMIDLAAEIEADFRRWPLFDKTPRVASHSDVGVIELMPTSDGETYGFKYVNGHPSNMKRGLQTVTAFGFLSDVATGYPVLMTEMTILTALRTAATSAMAAKGAGVLEQVAHPDAEARILERALLGLILHIDAVRHVILDAEQRPVGQRRRGVVHRADIAAVPPRAPALVAPGQAGRSAPLPVPASGRARQRGDRGRGGRSRPGRRRA